MWRSLVIGGDTCALGTGLFRNKRDDCTHLLIEHGTMHFNKQAGTECSSGKDYRISVDVQVNQLRWGQDMIPKVLRIHSACTIYIGRCATDSLVGALLMMFDWQR
jgi:hypothetical protein